MFTIDNFKVLEELRKTLGSINGVKNVQERVGLEYMLVIDNDQNKEGAQRVADALMQQASKFSFDLDIIVTTETELKEVQERMMAKISKDSQFKS